MSLMHEGKQHRAGDWPVESVESFRSEQLPAGTWAYTSPCGGVYVHLDATEFDFRIEVNPDTNPGIVADILDRVVHPLGFELIPEDECEVTESNTSGWPVIYLVPLVPVDDKPGHGYKGRSGIFLAASAALLATGPLFGLMQHAMEVVAA